MRKLLLFGCVATALCVNAEVLTPEAALQRVTSTSAPRVISKDAKTPALVYTEMTGAQPAAYVFDRGGADGYIIVSADDEAQALLGYSLAGTLDPALMPDGVKYWLGYYASEIEYLRANGDGGMVLAPAKVQYKSIAPMVATRWNQNSPFNDQCPMKDGSRTVTGCVATAMAQVMKYHNWPEKGKGSHEYT